MFDKKTLTDPATRALFFTLFVISGLALVFTSGSAHVPVHAPQTPRPTDIVVPGTPIGNVPPIPNPTIGKTGGNSVPQGNVGSNPGQAATGAGGLTKKASGPTSVQSTWEWWWSRNRYQFLDFPSLQDQAERMFPLTRAAGGNPDLLKNLRVDCVTRFRPLLNHDSARLRRASLIGLAMLDDQDSYEKMVESFNDGNQTVRDHAIFALGILDRSEAKHCLLHMAKGTPSACSLLGQTEVMDYFRGFAEVSLALEGTRTAGPLLRSILEDPKAPPQVRALALEGIGILGGEGSAKFLMDFVEQGKAPPEMLGTAVAALSKTEEPFIMPFLKKSLLHKEIYVRQSAALGLGCMASPGDDDLVKLLHRTYRHTNDQALKGFSLISVGRVGGPLAIKYLEDLVSKGPGTDVPWACLGLGFALRDHMDPKAVKHLIQQARTHGNRSTRGAAAISLGLARCKVAVSDLITLLNDADDPYQRGYCALALGMIGDPKAIDSLKQSLGKDPIPMVRTQAGMALALLKDSSSMLDLVDLLIQSGNDTTKSFVALSLSYMGDLAIVERLLASMDRYTLDDLTQAHCVHLAAKLLSGRPTPYLDRLAAGSNFACEYPIVGYLLDFGI